MVSRGACPPARSLLGATAAWNPTLAQKAAGRNAPGRPAGRGPGVGEGGRAGGRRASRVTCARRGPRPLPRCARACRPPGAAAAAARRRRAPGAGRLERRAAPAAALGSREGGSGPAPEAISFCASHMKAASRAPRPRCRRRRAERELHCAGTERAAAAAATAVSSPRAPGGAALAQRPCPRRASCPPALPARPPARSPPPRPGALESAEFAEREPFKFSALGCLERGLLARKKDGGERREAAARAAAGRGAPTTHPAAPRARGARAGSYSEPETGSGPRLPFPDPELVFVLRGEPLFLFSALEKSKIRRGPGVFFKLKLDRVRRGLVIISGLAHFHGLGRVWFGSDPRARPEARADRQVALDLLKTPRSVISTLLCFSHGFTRVREGEEQPRRCP